MKYIITINSQNYEVEVEKGEARVLSVTAAAPAPAAVVEVPAVAASAPTADATPAAAPSGKVLAAPMPGTILSIQKRVGDRVKAGEVVLILEAMKMENEVVAMHDGTVAQILVSKGSSVSTGDPLVMFN